MGKPVPKLKCPICNHKDSAYFLKIHMRNEHDKVMLEDPTTKTPIYVDTAHYHSFVNTYGRTELDKDFKKYRINLSDNFLYKEQPTFKLKQPAKTKVSAESMFKLEEFQRMSKTAKSLEGLLPHQLFFLSLAQNIKVSGRKIIIVCDEMGNSGKSTLYNYTQSRSGYVTYSCSLNEIKQMRQGIRGVYKFTDFFNDATIKLTAFINILKYSGQLNIDMHTCSANLERLCDGDFGGGCFRNVHCVVCLTNWSPRQASHLCSRLSPDRIEIYEVVEKIGSPKVVEIYRVEQSSCTNMSMMGHIIPVQTFHSIAAMPPEIVASIVKNSNDICRALTDHTHSGMGDKEQLDDDVVPIDYNDPTATLLNLDQFYDQNCIVPLPDRHIIFHRSSPTSFDHGDYDRWLKILNHSIDEAHRQTETCQKNIESNTDEQLTDKLKEYFNSAYEFQVKLTNEVRYIQNRWANLVDLTTQDLQEIQERSRRIAAYLTNVWRVDFFTLWEDVIERGEFDYSLIPEKSIPLDPPLTNIDLSNAWEDVFPEQSNEVIEPPTPKSLLVIESSNPAPSTSFEKPIRKNKKTNQEEPPSVEMKETIQEENATSTNILSVGRKRKMPPQAPEKTIPSRTPTRPTRIPTRPKRSKMEIPENDEMDVSTEKIALVSILHICCFIYIFYIVCAMAKYIFIY